MASMTDYLEEKALQESATVTSVEETEEQLAQAVLESYIAMTAAFANAECMMEHATIAAFCKEAEIETPDIVQESAWDTIVNAMSDVVEWFKNLLKGFIGLFAASKITKLIAKLKQLSAAEEIKMDSDIAMMAFYTESMFDALELFNQKIIEEADDVKAEEVKNMITTMEQILDKDAWRNGALKNDETSLGSVRMKKIAKADHITISELIETLEKINKANIPGTGSALLKSLKFDKTKYTKTDAQGNATTDVDKELVKDINKLARLIAKAYDKITSGLIKVTDIAYGKTEVVDKEQFKADEEAAKKDKNTVKYNSSGATDTRPRSSMDEYFG